LDGSKARSTPNAAAIEKEKEKQNATNSKTVYLKDLEEEVGKLSILATVAEVLAP